jgi:hypothetical protein
VSPSLPLHCVQGLGFTCPPDRVPRVNSAKGESVGTGSGFFAPLRMTEKKLFMKRNCHIHLNLALEKGSKKKWQSLYAT